MVNVYNTPDTGHLLTFRFRVADTATLGAVVPVNLNILGAGSAFPAVEWSAVAVANNGAVTIGEPQAPFVWGDVSGDGFVTMADVDLILMYLAGFIAADDLDLRAAKVAGNPTVTMVDVDMILMYLADFIDTLDPNA